MASNNRQDSVNNKNNAAVELREDQMLDELDQEVQNLNVDNKYTEKELAAAFALVEMSRQHIPKPMEKAVIQVNNRVETNRVSIISNDDAERIQRRNHRRALLSSCLRILNDLEEQRKSKLLAFRNLLVNG